MYSKYFKRLFDLVVSFSLLVFLLPIFIIVAFICLISFQGQIFFTQPRVGKDEKIFTVIKFITMKPVSKQNISDSDRLTSSGRFLRRTSLDELPQLINVLKGDMSLIGPRPLLVKYIPYYHEHEKIRHSVRPGITGLAQINGRNNVSWDERLNYDITYAKNLTLKTDILIFVKTIIHLIFPKNIQTDPRSVMPDLDEERRGKQLFQNKK